MSTSIDVYTPYALTILILTVFLTLFFPPLVSYIRAARRSAVDTKPQYLNLCGSQARHNIRRPHASHGVTHSVPASPPRTSLPHL